DLPWRGPVLGATERCRVIELHLRQESGRERNEVRQRRIAVHEDRPPIALHHAPFHARRKSSPFEGAEESGPLRDRWAPANTCEDSPNQRGVAGAAQENDVAVGEQSIE